MQKEAAEVEEALDVYYHGDSIWITPRHDHVDGRATIVLGVSGDVVVIKSSRAVTQRANNYRFSRLIDLFRPGQRDESLAAEEF